MRHVDPEVLAALALDPTDGSREDLAHVAGCVECSAYVLSLADVRRLAGAGALVPVPSRVREALLAEVRGPAPAQPVVLPVGRNRRRRVPAWVAAVAAVVTLVAGLGLGRFLATDPEPRRDPTTVVAATALTALDSDAPRGEAEAVRSADTITLRVRARDLGKEAGFHEVWLINVDGTRMVSVGVLAHGDDGEFQVPRGLLDEGYRIVDISIEPDDGDPTHSGVSLARGELAEA